MSLRGSPEGTTKQSKIPKVKNKIDIVDCFVRAKALLAMTYYVYCNSLTNASSSNTFTPSSFALSNFEPASTPATT
jgi:hypothetical protein